jgi:hypothetical protein
MVSSANIVPHWVGAMDLNIMPPNTKQPTSKKDGVKIRMFILAVF